ncbi:MAG: oxidoreductase, Gfo/Idh/MocA family [Bryobacterales bacterium]|nr:oxidoreductase, Gfo/Idh/MocA family [Bryobacterales bacterium]
MANKIRWGVLGVAKIATVKVIPAMQHGSLCEISAIASRDPDRARKAADDLGISKAYGSYEELLADPDIDAVYNPLPNHLHVPWTLRAAAAGKHVLCEKPIALSAAEASQLLVARDRAHVKIGEAFMVHSHPQWLRALEILRSGEIGPLRAFNFVFSYNNRDPQNIRNRADIGGGAIMDIGCYPVHVARWMFGAEPARVSCLIERDPQFGTDRLTSAILDFPAGQAVFTCSTQMTPFQRVQLFGESGLVEIEIPVNAPPDRETVLNVRTSAGSRTETIPPCDQYTLQGDAFSRAILEDTEVPVPLEDAIRNMEVIDALFESGRTGRWVTVHI